MDIPASRSWSRKEVSVDVLRDIVREVATGTHAEASVRRAAERTLTQAARGDDLAVDIVVCDRSIELDELETGRRPFLGLLIVLGDLLVRGLYSDSLDPDAAVIVTGDLRCERLLSEGFLEVHGSVLVEHEALFFDNDGCAEIFGDLRAGFIYTQYHSVHVHGRVEAPIAFGDDRRRITAGIGELDLLDDTDEANKEIVRAHLVPEALVLEGDLEDEWWIDEVKADVLRRKLLAGERLWRAPTLVPKSPANG